MGTRNDDPTQGRFTSRDTQFGNWDDPNTLNQYVYAADSPVFYADPTGMQPACDGCDQKEREALRNESAAAVRNVVASAPATLPGPPPIVIRMIVRALGKLDRGADAFCNLARPQNAADWIGVGAFAYSTALNELRGESGFWERMGATSYAMGARGVGAQWMGRGVAMSRWASALSFGGRVGRGLPLVGVGLTFASERLQGHSLSRSIGGTVGATLFATGAATLVGGACEGGTLGLGTPGCALLAGGAAAIAAPIGQRIGEDVAPVVTGAVSSTVGATEDLAGGVTDELGSLCC
jgi:hypothetical protein